MEPNVPNQKLAPGVYQGTPTTEPKTTAQRVIRTMKSDASEAIRNQEETTVSIAIAEEKKRARQQAEALAAKQESLVTTPPAPKPVHRFVVVLVILLILALLGLAYVFVLPKLKGITLPSISLPSFPKAQNPTTPATTTPTTTPLAASIITADSEKRFDITKDSAGTIAQGIKDEAQQSLAIGFIKNIYFTEGSTPASTSRLLAFENIIAPEILSRSLEKTFMVGLLGEEGNSATPFIILKVSDANTGIAGMLEWEPTLPTLFNAFFGTNMAIVDASSIKFHDVVISAKDARSFTAPSGDTLLYAFANPTTIVITKTKGALENLLSLASTPTSR